MAFPDEQELKREGAELLSALIRFDTTNPPGNETPCALYLKEWLERRNISSQVFESAPGRGNLIARVEGLKGAEPLLLLSHLDVVPAVASDWSVHPFSGEVLDGSVWGRGAIDCKGPSVMQALALWGLVKDGFKFNRDVILSATADEETGGKMGVEWLIENHREKFFAPFALNEGGGFGFKFRGRTYVTCQTMEKKICWIELEARGEAGHASTPIDDSAMNRMAKALAKLADHRAPLNKDSKEALNVMWKGFAGNFGYVLAWFSSMPVVRDALLSLISSSSLRRTIRAMLSNTISITLIKGGEKANVIPSRVSATLDCRLLPGMTHEEMLADIQKVVEKYGVEARLSTRSKGSHSDADSPLYRAIESAVTALGAEYRLTPILSTGATDGRHLAAYGCKVYGFVPLMPDKGNGKILRAIHGVDERISLDNIAFGARLIADVVRRFCGV